MWRHSSPHATQRRYEGTLMRNDTDCLLTCCSVHCSHEPGFRDLYLQVVGHDGQRIRNIELLVSPSDVMDIFAHVLALQQEAWANGEHPLDAEPGERRPAWIKDQG